MTNKKKLRTPKLVPAMEPEIFIRGWQALVAAERQGNPLAMMDGMSAVGRLYAMAFGLRMSAVAEIIEDPRIAEWTNEDGLHISVLVAAATSVLRLGRGFDANLFFQNVKQCGVVQTATGYVLTF